MAIINKHILKHVLVPVEQRLEVYIEALRIIQHGTDVEKNRTGDGLCLMLPVILWNLDHYLSDSPDGEMYDYTKTIIMFPEIAKTVEYLMSSKSAIGDRGDERETLRVLCLKNAIKSCKKEINEK